MPGGFLPRATENTKAVIINALFLNLLIVGQFDRAYAHMEVHPAYKPAVSHRRSMPAHSSPLGCEAHLRRKSLKSSRYNRCRSDDDAQVRAGKEALWYIPASDRGLLRRQTENRRAEIPMPYPGGRRHHVWTGNRCKCRGSQHGHR